MSSNIVTLKCPACNAPFPAGSSNKMEIVCPYCGQVTYNNFAVRNRSDAINTISVVVPGCTDDDVKRFFIEELVRTDYVPVDVFDSFSIENTRHNMYPIYVFNVNWLANWSAVFSHQVSHEEPTYDFNGKRTGTKTVFETEYRDANGTSAGDSRVVLSGLIDGFPNQSEICESYSWSTVIDPEFPEIETKGISDVESEELNGWELIEPNMSGEEAWKNGGKDVIEDDVDRQVTKDTRSMSAGWIVESRHYTYRYSEGKGQCVLLPIWEADYQYANEEYLASVDSWTGEVYLEQYPKDETVEGLKEKTDEEISSKKTLRTVGYVFFGIFSALTILFLALPSFSENRIAFCAMLVLAIVSWVLTRLAQRKKLYLENNFKNKLWDDKIKRSEAAERKFGIKVKIGEEPEKRTLEFWVDIMVYVIFGIVFFIAITQGLFANLNNKHDIRPRANYKTSTTTISSQSNTTTYHQKSRVYSNAYDGYVNIRQEPHSNAPVIGKFCNGPDGAILLSKEGDWTKIDCNGIVGYVYTKYVQGDPTVAYKGTATIEQIAGVYEYCYGFCQYLFLYYDGTYRVGGEDDEMGRGHYTLQNNEVKLIPVYESNTDLIEHILPIDVNNNKLGKYNKQPFLTESDISRAKAQYGEYWREELYGESVYLGTLKDFKKLSAFE